MTPPGARFQSIAGHIVKKGVDNMRSPKTAFVLSGLIMLVGVTLTAAGLILLDEAALYTALYTALLIIGIILFISGLYLDNRYVRCPHCDSHLGRVQGSKCPYCGREL